MKPIYLTILGLTALLLAACGPKPAPAPPAPPEVLVMTVDHADVPIFSEAIATLDGSTNTQIHSQVTGYLTKQNYIEGSVVQPGQLLFQIDPKPFQADLDKAKATLANKVAVQKSTQQVLDRYTLLVKSGAISQQEYQNQVQSNLAAQADVQAAQASVDTAQINLGYTRITSPIVGVAGRALPYIGDLISPSVTMTTVSTVNPIQADFTVPEQFYLNNADRIAEISSIPLADRSASIQLVLPDGSIYPHLGRFYYINRQVQTSTGALAAFALFPNPDRVLRPGQYAKVRAITEQINNAVLVPQRAVIQLQGLTQVIVVKPDNTAEVRDVTTGDTAGSNWIITDGLKVGERVVVEGIQKCRDGSLVDPKPWVAPPAQEPQVPPTNAPPPALPPGP
ncbi:MAG: efflux RND transporter periplasmic adaptor subunit [Verrucomicrobiota bacterium]